MKRLGVLDTMVYAGARNWIKGTVIRIGFGYWGVVEGVDSPSPAQWTPAALRYAHSIAFMRGACKKRWVCL